MKPPALQTDNILITNAITHQFCVFIVFYLSLIIFILSSGIIHNIFLASLSFLILSGILGCYSRPCAHQKSIPLRRATD